MAQLLRDARHARLALAFPPGVGVALAAPAGGVQAPVQPVEDGSKWVIVESGDDCRRCEEVTLDGTEVLRDMVGLKQAGGNWYAIRKVLSNELALYPGREASQQRLLGLTFAGTTREEREWRDVAKESHEEKILDWGVPGHGTSSWCLKFINRRNGGPSDPHRWWVQNNGLQQDSWGVQEHDNLSKIIDRLVLT